MEYRDAIKLIIGKTVKDAKVTDTSINDIEIEFTDGTKLSITHSGDDMSYVDFEVKEGDNNGLV